MNNTNQLAQIVWNYLCMNEPVPRADVILVLGSHDLRVAERGAELYLEGLAPLLIFSGGFGRLTDGFVKPEAEMFADIAVEAGVPADHILIENKSTNTGENVRFSYDLLQSQGVDPERFAVVTKPYMERRALATFKKVLPEKDAFPTSPLIDFEHYPTDTISKDDVINIMLGDLQRIKVYPDLGYQIPMAIPDEVWNAFEQLVARGYNQHVIKVG